ncbi:MAG: VCBS repeat-containing protein [Saprospirales bacterium]|nr:VCBS repeat-containing protein [Saprospirales bacterium]
MMYRIFSPLWMAILVCSCKNAASDDFLRAEHTGAAPVKPTTSFERIPASHSGINFVPTLQESFQYNFLLDPYEYNGGGVAVLDVDNDGLQDLFFTHRFNGCRLYRNKGNLQFEDISDRSGISGFSGLKTGVAVVDINADGWSDLYVCRTWLTNVPDRRNLLFVNNRNGTFSEQAAAFGIDDPSPSQCANFFDYDLDGDLDLYVVNHPVDFRTMNNIEYQPRPEAPLARSLAPRDSFESDKLFRNTGTGRFEDVSRQAGIHNRAYGLSATTADFNDDGWPDLLVANDFVMPDFLYINNGDGTFREEAHRWFAHTANHSMGCDIADFNNDACPDICIPDMLGSTLERQKSLMSTMILARTQLMEKQGYGRQQMRNVLQLGSPPQPPHAGGSAAPLNAQRPSGSRNLQAAGAPAPPHGEGRGGFFAEIGCLAGIEATEWSWAPLLADFDNDGWKDLFISAGVYRDLNDLDFFFYTADSLNKTGGITEDRFRSFEEFAGKMSSYPVHNFMFQNTGTLRFRDVSEAWGLGDKGFSNGGAYADLDNDGDLDLIVNKLDAPATIYQNMAAQTNGNAWLQIKCRGAASNPAGAGAKIWVHAGGQVFYQEMTPVRGFYSSVEPIFQVGLGKTTRIDRVEIEWPQGLTQVLENVPPNRRLVLDIAQATPGRLQRPAAPTPWFNEVPAQSRPAFIHRENDFDDFSRERLLLHRFSTGGPCLTAGDVNADGLDDFFAGGAAGQPGAVFRQQPDGRFSPTPQPALEADARSEDSDALLFDADADGDADLYVASGSNEAAAGSDYYQDRLYFNDGKGNFTRRPEALPREHESGAVVCAWDFDRDGDADLFVGSGVIPGRFPETPKSLLLQNDGTGRFTSVASNRLGGLERAGMVSDALAADLDGDQRAELIVCGEWMPVRVFQFEAGKVVEASAKFGLHGAEGLWNCLAAADFDGDGDLDLIAGNEGLNTRLKATPGAPLRLFALDFDLDQKLDPVVAIAEQGRYYPLAQRNELAAQMPNLIKSKFLRYRSYARAPVEDVFDPKKLRAAQRLEVRRLASAWFRNSGGKMEALDLPLEAQVSCIQRILVRDFTGDDRPEVLLLGNDTQNAPETGPYDACFGVLLEMNGKNTWHTIPNRKHGLWAGGEVRDGCILRLAGGRKGLLAGVHNAPVRFWSVENRTLLK